MKAQIATILLCLLLGGCAVTTIDFAQKDSGCKNVSYHPLCDADVHTAFPELKPSDEILDVDSFDRFYDDGEDLFINYTPDVTGPHTVLTKEVVCQQANDRQQFWCHMVRNEAYFYSKPTMDAPGSSLLFVMDDRIRLQPTIRP